MESVVTEVMHIVPSSDLGFAHPLLGFTETDLADSARQWGVPALLADNPYRLLIVVSFVAHLLLNAISHLVFRVLMPVSYGERSMHKIEWNTRIVSTIHALVTGLGTLFVFATEMPHVWGSYSYTHSFIAKLVSAYSAGYFVADFAIVAVFHRHFTSVLSTLLHHTMAAGAFMISLHKPSSEGVVLLFLFTELSTPFVNIRWFLLETGHKESVWFTRSSYAMGISFFLVRIVGMPWLVYCVVSSFPDLLRVAGWVGPIVVGACIAGVCFLNLMWFNMILQGLKKGSGKSPTKNSPAADATAAVTTTPTADGNKTTPHDPVMMLRPRTARVLLQGSHKHKGADSEHRGAR